MKRNKVFEGNLKRAKSNILFAGSVLKVSVPKDYKEKELLILMWRLMDEALNWLERTTVIYRRLTKEHNDEINGH